MNNRTQRYWGARNGYTFKGKTMSDELQTDAGETPVDESPIEQTIQEGSESAPDTGENQEQKVTFSEDQQKIFDTAMGRGAKATGEAKREAEQLRQQLADAQARIPQETKPVIPDLPSEFDDDFDAKMGVRDQAIRDSANFDVRQQVTQYQHDQAALVQQKEAQRKAQERATAFTGNAVKQGIKPEELQSAAATVDAYRLRQDVVDVVMDDKMGGLIAIHLAKNPQAIESLNNASLVTLGSVYDDIKKQAVAQGKKQPTAPDPVDTLGGQGVARKMRGPKGAKFS